MKDIGDHVCVCVLWREEMLSERDRREIYFSLYICCTFQLCSMYFCFKNISPTKQLLNCLVQRSRWARKMPKNGHGPKDSPSWRRLGSPVPKSSTNVCFNPIWGYKTWALMVLSLLGWLPWLPTYAVKHCNARTPPSILCVASCACSIDEHFLKALSMPGSVAGLQSQNRIRQPNFDKLTVK